MISTKKLIKMATKWQGEATSIKRIISFPRINVDTDADTSNVANKGHFVIYTIDQQRFVIPLQYLNNSVFRELFKMSEDEFGLPKDGPILLPCDALFMKYIVENIQRGMAKEIEKALLISISATCCSQSSCHQGQTNSQVLVCGY